MKSAAAYRFGSILTFFGLAPVLFLYALLFIVLLGIGGTSMAAVEGAVGGGLLAESAATEAVVWLNVAQAFIVPWAAGVTFFARRRVLSG